MAFPCIYGYKECDGCGRCESKYEIFCECCGEPLTDYFYDIGGEILCEDCMNEIYRQEVCYELEGDDDDEDA